MAADCPSDRSTDRPTDDLLRRILAAVATDDGATDVRRLLDDCRAEAEAEVKAVIKTAMKAALLRRAVEELESGVEHDSFPVEQPRNSSAALEEPAPDERAAVTDDNESLGHRGRLDAFAAAMSSPHEAQSPAAEPRSHQQPTQPTACYVYAIGAAGSDHWMAGVTAIDPAFPLRVVRHGDVQAVVSDVGLDDFHQATLDRRVTQPEWVESKVRAHDQVIRAAMQAGTVIPCRFCTVLRHDEDVRQLLDVHRERIADTLAQLEGKQEWGVKIFAVPIQAEKKSGGDIPEGGGKAYLQRRKREDARRDELDREARDHARACHDELAAAIAADVVILPRRPRTGGGVSNEPLLNGAYLIAQEDVERFHGLIAAMQERHGPLGLKFEVTGPWPPYNFVRLDLSLEAAA